MSIFPRTTIVQSLKDVDEPQRRAHVFPVALRPEREVKRALTAFASQVGILWAEFSIS